MLTRCFSVSYNVITINVSYPSCIRNIAMRDYQDSVTETDAGQSDPNVPLCFAGHTNICKYLYIDTLNGILHAIMKF